ncbi:hypothetical protein CLIB1423_03S04412 [[Candida] railenensis]|uniref:Uncharacterized protein n=1 Tax=[Candida] railenensis TaxID=45579 RepID=A0A9P0QMW1_9ASCO|nr:hypothetical protein CLIB1423_03S04412 [[Candida] railenensis]
MFFLLFIGALLIALIIILPSSAGLLKLERNTRTKKSAEPERSKNPSSSSGQEYSGYLPPDEYNALQEQKREQYQKESSIKARASALKDKINFTANDIPVKFSLQDQQRLRHRNKERLDIDNNPNNYDYDLDELINEEKEKSLEDQQREAYKNEVLGQDKEAMV